MMTATRFSETKPRRKNQMKMMTVRAKPLKHLKRLKLNELVDDEIEDDDDEDDDDDDGSF